MAETDLIEKSVEPVMEFFRIENPARTSGGNWHIFSSKAAPQWSDLQERLQAAHGIYVFHDSSGRGIYAGKALRQNLWSEINSAFNRQRGEVQSIKRVDLTDNRLRKRGEKETD
jgi:hypothetical protein